LPLEFVQSWMQSLYVLLQSLYELIAGNDEKAVFLILLVEEAGIPLPAPGDLVIMYAGYRAAAGEMGLIEAVLAVTVSVQMGSTILYLISRRVGPPLLYRYGRFVRLDRDRIDALESWIQRHGPVVVLAGRLTPGLRITTSIAAGAFRIPFPQFLLFTTMAAGIWGVFWLVLGYFFGSSLLPVLEAAHKSPVFLVAAVATVFTGLSAYWWWRRQGRAIVSLALLRSVFRVNR
jgi:membrane protein DedA with SNARE-associated domain